MKKYQIGILVLAGILSFSASFGVSWFKKRQAVQAAAAVIDATQTETTVDPRTASSVTETYSFLDADASDRESLGMTERQLQNLIYDVREKMRDYENRQRELDQEANRIELSRKSLQEDIEHLNALREKLNMTMAALNEKEKRIQNTLIEIEDVEKANIQRLATTYDRMDAEQAGRIMLTMAANNQMQDVVKILYYMNDRNAARLLGTIGQTRPEIAGALSLQLKRIKEGG